MISNPISGATYFINGLSLINTSGIRRFVFVPLLINILIFSAGLWFAIAQFETFIEWALSSLPDWLSWLEWIMWPLFAVTFYGLVFFGFSIIANIIAAPFNGPLAAAVERRISGNEDFSSNKTFIQEAKDSIGNELIKLRYSLYLMMPLAFLSLISFAFPLISPAIAVLWLVYTVWILTLEYADFPMANHGIAFRHIREKLANKRFLSLGFGSMVMLATLIPFVNFIVMPVAVAGATKMYVTEFKI
jgi:CysZ protein